jgi:hypothetical protein
MITGPDMYRRAVAAVRRLEAKVKDGTATDEERARYRAGCDHVLIYTWAGDPTPAVEVIPRAEPEPEQSATAPEAVAFANWYERTRSRWGDADYLEALVRWWGERPAARLVEIEADVERELTERGLWEPYSEQEHAA